MICACVPSCIVYIPILNLELVKKGGRQLGLIYKYYYTKDKVFAKKYFAKTSGIIGLHKKTHLPTHLLEGFISGHN